MAIRTALKKNILQQGKLLSVLKGIEACAVPILSVLNLQLQRSLFLKKSWLYPDEVTNLDPSDHGYRREKDGTFSVNLQDVTDPFYSLPRKDVPAEQIA